MPRSLMRWIVRSIFPAYLGLHIYAYVQLTTAWEPSLGKRILFGTWLVLMVLSLFFIRRLEMSEYRRLAATTAWMSYTWMGFIFLFFFASLSTQFFIFITEAVAAPQYFGSRTALIEPIDITLALSIGLSIYALWRGAWPKLVRVSLSSHHLPSGACLRLIQISDLHLGIVPTPLRLKRIVALIKAASPDLVVSTGDFTDLRTDQPYSGLSDLAALKAPLGKYAVIGNHECYAGLPRSEQVLQQAGFTVLRQRWVNLGGFIQLAGVDDPVAVGGRPHLEEEALHNADPENFTVLLKHRPELEPSMVDRIDLQLSGHTHDGQIFPFTLLPRLIYPVRPGLTRFGRAALYLSRGTGTWGPPMRFPFAPEVTLFEIKRKE
ncbi:metallophosphoesterase [Nitrosococcus wardiae]|nr:metallophosphoesterase [Nitrosococcus wardiae]